MDAEDRDLLRRLLMYMSDHGGGSGPFPECELSSCASCQALYLLERLASSDQVAS